MKKTIISALLIFLVLLTGCSAGSKSASSQSATSTPSYDLNGDAAMEESWDSGEEESVPNESGAENDYGGHKIIKTASLGLQTREFDAVLASTKEKAASLGGYVANSNVNGKRPEVYGDSGRYATLTFRIPQDKMESFLASARGLATVTYENTGTEDITMSYYDTQSRLELYETQRERTMELLEKASKLEDILSLESEITRLTYEIESLTTQLKQWDDLVDFATVTLDVSEVVSLSAAAGGEESVWTRIQHGITDNFNGVIVFFENLFVFIVSASPILVVLAVVFLIVFWIVKRSAKKSRARLAAQGGVQYVSPYAVPGQVSVPLEGSAPKAKEEKREEKDLHETS